MAVKLDNYLMYITNSFFNGRTYRPACKALSITQGKKEQWLILRQIIINFTAIELKHLQRGVFDAEMERGRLFELCLF